MSARYGTTLILIDLPTEEEANLELIQRFIFLYLHLPMLNNSKQKKSIVFNSASSANDPSPETMTWTKVVQTLQRIKLRSPDDTHGNLLKSLSRSFTYISASNSNDYHILVLTAFQNQWEWSDTFQRALKTADQSIKSMKFVDLSSAKDNDNVAFNLSILKSLTSNTKYLTLAQALNYVSHYQNITLPNPEPVELFKGSMTIPIGLLPESSPEENQFYAAHEKLSNLNFQIGMYPLIKSKVLSNYVDNKLTVINQQSPEFPNKITTSYIEQIIDPNDMRTRLKVEVDKSDISKGFKVGNSNFVSNLDQFDQLPTHKSLTIYSFLSEREVLKSPWIFKPDTVAILPSKTSSKRDLAIYSDLGQHLAQNQLCAIARMVKKDNSPPKQVVLFSRGYIDELVEKTGEIKLVGLVMCEIISLDDFKLPNLLNINSVEVEEDTQRNMDNLVDSLNFIDDKNSSSYDESLMFFNDPKGAFDKLSNNSEVKPKDDLLIDGGTFTSIWKETVSFNEEQKVLANLMGFDTVKRWIENNDNTNSIPSLWNMYYEDAEANKSAHEQIIKENWKIEEPEFLSKEKTFKAETLSSIFQFEKKVSDS